MTQIDSLLEFCTREVVTEASSSSYWSDVLQHGLVAISLLITITLALWGVWRERKSREVAERRSLLTEYLNAGAAYLAAKQRPLSEGSTDPTIRLRIAESLLVAELQHKRRTNALHLVASLTERVRYEQPTLEIELFLSDAQALVEWVGKGTDTATQQPNSI